MKVSDFAVKVAEIEGMKKPISIAQVKEVMRIIDSILGGELYKIIRSMK